MKTIATLDIDICSACKGNNFSPFYTKDKLSLIRCKACGLVQLSGKESVFDPDNYSHYEKRTGFSKRTII